MATARAIANGNWSSTSTWNGGVVPGNGDTVYANGFNITLDVDVNIGGANNPTVNTGSLVAGQWYEIVNVGGQNWSTIGAASNSTGTVFLSTGTGTAGNLGTAKAIATLTTATNASAGATIGGGVFTMSTARAMTADLRAGSTACVNVTGAISPSWSGVRLIAGTGAASHAVIYAGTQTLTLSGGCLLFGSATSSTNAFAVNNSSSGTVAINGSTLTAGGSANHAVQNSSSGTIAVSNCILSGGSGSAGSAVNNNSSNGVVTITDSTATGGNGNNTFALNNASTGGFTISASTLVGGTNQTGYALNNTSTGTVICTSCTFTASAFTNAINLTNSGADVRLSGDFLDHWSGWKAISGAKWRLGTTPTSARTRYALAGTTDSYVEMYTADNTGFGLPAANHVRSGISYGGGAVTGTCSVPAAGSVALGVPVDNTTGTAILTQANVQSALTAQGLTSARAGALDNLDAAVSSRLAPNGTLATVTNLTNAPASVTPADIWDYNSRTLTSAAPPSAVAIRQELDANSTRLANLDAPVSGATAPSAAAVAGQVRTELSPELAKVASLNTDRLAQCSTVATTGAQLAAALS